MSWESEEKASQISNQRCISFFLKFVKLICYLVICFHRLFTFLLYFPGLLQNRIRTIQRCFGTIDNICSLPLALFFLLGFGHFCLTSFFCSFRPDSLFYTIDTRQFGCGYFRNFSTHFLCYTFWSELFIRVYMKNQNLSENDMTKAVFLFVFFRISVKNSN